MSVAVLFLVREDVDPSVGEIPEIKSYLGVLAEGRETDTQLLLGEGDILSDERILI